MEGNEGTSNLVFFTIQADTVAPTIGNLQPANGATLYDWQVVASATFSDTQPGSGVSDIPADLTVSIQRDGAPLALEAPNFFKDATGFNFTPSDDLAPGVYSVHVQIKDNAGNESLAADWTFTLGLTSPGIIAPNADLGSTTPTFEWTDVPHADGYELKVFNVTAGTDITVSTGFTQPNQPANDNWAWTPDAGNALLPGHTYYWSVTAKRALGALISQTVSSNQFLVLMDVPTQTSPTGNESATTPTFVFGDNVPHADSYEIQITDQTPGTTEAVRTITGITASPYTLDDQVVSALTRGHTYLWKARAVPAQGTPSLWSDPGFLFLVAFDAPIAVAPVPTGGEQYAYVPTTTPTFEWQAVDGVHLYEIQVFLDGTLVATKPGIGRQLTTWTYDLAYALVNGQDYTWTIKALPEIGTAGPASTPQPFLIGDITPPTITNLVPAGGQTYYDWQSNIGATFSDPQPGSGVSDNTADLTVDIKRDNVALDLGPHTFTKNENGFTLDPGPDLEPGVYDVHALIKDKEGNASAPADWTFTLGLTSSVIVSPNADLSATTPTFEWTDVPHADGYELKVFNITTGTDITVTTGFTQPNQPANDNWAWTPDAGNALLPGHTYYWTVTAKRALGTLTSQTVSSNLLFVFMEVPAQIAPIDNEAAITPSFVFGAVPNADTYEIQIIDQTPGTTEAVRTITGIAASPYVLDDQVVQALTRGHTYLWKIRAVHAQGTASLWSDPGLTFLVALQVPVAVAPVPQAPETVAYDNSTNGEPTFSWTAVAGASDYEITIKQADNTLVGTVSGIGTTSWLYNGLPPLAEGADYKWSVVAWPAIGTPSLPSTETTFRVDLTAPSVAADLPADNTDLQPGATAITGTWTNGGPGTPSPLDHANVEISFSRIPPGESTPIPFAGTVTSNDTGFTFETTPVAPLPDGTYSVQARIPDLAGNLQPAPTSWTFRIDGQAPAVAAPIYPADGSNLKVEPTQITGSIQNTNAVSEIDPSSLVLTFRKGEAGSETAITLTGTPTVDLQAGTFAYSLSPGLADDRYEVTAKISDEAGNESAPFVWAFRLDRAHPLLTSPLPVATGTFSDAVIISAEFSDIDQASGLGSGVNVSATTIYLNETPIHEILLAAGDLNENGFNYDPSEHGLLPEGPNSVEVELFDHAENSQSFSWEFEIDTTGPVIAAPFTPTDNSYINYSPSQISGEILNLGSPIDQTSLLVTWAMGIPGAETPITVNGSIEFISESNFIYNLADTLEEERYVVTVSIADQAGNRSDPVSWAFTVDLTPPTIEVVAPIQSSVTNDPSSPVNVTFSDENGIYENGLDLKINGEPASFNIEWDVSGEPGGLSYIPSFPLHLPEGTNEFAVSVMDNAGNAASINWTILVDTVPPQFQNVTPLEKTFTQDRDYTFQTDVLELPSESGIDWANATYALYITTTDQSYVYDLNGSVTPTGDTITIVPSTITQSDFPVAEWLPEGEIIVELTVPDYAGNIAFKRMSIVVDLTPPPAPIVSETYSVNGMIALTGYLPIGDDIASIIVGTTGNVATPTGAITPDKFVATLGNFDQGITEFEYTLQYIDKAGNAGAVLTVSNQPTTVIPDPEDPPQALEIIGLDFSIPADPDLNLIERDETHITNSDSATLYFTVLGGEAPYTFDITYGNSATQTTNNTGASHSVSLSGLEEGVLFVQVQVTDNLGDTAIASAELISDRTPPEIVLVRPFKKTTANLSCLVLGPADLEVITDPLVHDPDVMRNVLSLGSFKPLFDAVDEYVEPLEIIASVREVAIQGEGIFYEFDEDTDWESKPVVKEEGGTLADSTTTAYRWEWPTAFADSLLDWGRNRESRILAGNNNELDPATGLIKNTTGGQDTAYLGVIKSMYFTEFTGYQLVITVRDALGNERTEKVLDFVIDRTPPEPHANRYFDPVQTFDSDQDVLFADQLIGDEKRPLIKDAYDGATGFSFSMSVWRLAMPSSIESPISVELEDIAGNISTTTTFQPNQFYSPTVLARHSPLGGYYAIAGDKIKVFLGKHLISKTEDQRFTLEYSESLEGLMVGIPNTNWTADPDDPTPVFGDAYRLYDSNGTLADYPEGFVGNVSPLLVHKRGDYFYSPQRFFIGRSDEFSESADKFPGRILEVEVPRIDGIEDSTLSAGMALDGFDIALHSVLDSYNVFDIDFRYISSHEILNPSSPNGFGPVFIHELAFRRF